MIKSILIVVPPLVPKNKHNNEKTSKLDFEAHRLISPIDPLTTASDLIQRGFEPSVFDLGLYKVDGFEKLSKRIISLKPDAVVIMQSVLTFATAQDWDGKRVFDIVKEHYPKAVTVLTGSHATNYPGKAVGEGICDYSIKGEVDFEIGNLFTVINQGDPLLEIEGLAFKVANGHLSVSEHYPSVDITQLPIPAYHLIDKRKAEQYAEMLEFGKIRFPARSPKYRDIMTSRSCLLRCSFCSVSHLRGNRQKYRRKTLNQIIQEIEVALVDGIEEIHFFDDLFADSEKQILKFTDELIKRKLKFHWFVAQGMPLWPLTETALSAMKETGMYRIICPLESGNNRVLKEVIGKVHSTVEHHHNVISWAKKLNLEIIGMFVVGMPGEKRSEILDTICFAEKHPEIDYSVFSIATPMVGTRLMKKITKHGQLSDPDKINRVIKRTVALYETSEFSAYELGVIRAFDWDRINFSIRKRQIKYANMVGLTLDQLESVREYSKETFYQFFPGYDGPLSFNNLYTQPNMFEELDPIILEKLY